MSEQETDVTIEAGGRKVRTTLRALEEVGRRDQRPPEFGIDDEPEQLGYVLSDEVASVAREVIAGTSRFDHIAHEGIRVGYALQVGKKPEGKGGLHVLAKAVKAPTLWRDLGVHEVVVWANALAWARLSERARHALMAHELSHIGGRTESGTLTLLEHDIEEFGWVVRNYGQWHSGLEFFAEQLGLGLATAKGPQP